MHHGPCRIEWNTTVVSNGMCCSILLVFKGEISYAAGHTKEIYFNEKNIAGKKGQEFVCSWALEKEEVTTSMCTLR